MSVAASQRSSRRGPVGTNRGRVAERIVRERVSGSGHTEYCVSWSLEGAHSGFTWETPIFLYDSGHTKLVRSFENSQLIRRGLPTPAHEFSSPTGSRLLATSPAPAALAPIIKNPIHTRSGPRRSGSSSRNRSKGLVLDSLLDSPQMPHSKSLFDDSPHFDPKASSRKSWDVGYSPIRETESLRFARKIARICGKSDDELRRGMMQAEVKQFLVVKSGVDMERIEHLRMNPKERGQLPGSYDRLQYIRNIASVRIQTRIRTSLARRQFRKLMAAAGTIQRYYRCVTHGLYVLCPN